MNKQCLTACLAWTLCGMAAPVLAETVSCPDLSQARQVGACPSEEELKYTFTGYCSDDNKAYRGETDVCTDYQAYRSLKNVALWESADGLFSAYLSCGPTGAKLPQRGTFTLRALPQGKLTRLVCNYAEGIAFTHRTRAQCRVDVASCSATATDCKAVCD